MPTCSSSWAWLAGTTLRCGDAFPSLKPLCGDTWPTCRARNSQPLKPPLRHQGWCSSGRTWRSPPSSCTGSRMLPATSPLRGDNYGRTISARVEHVDLADRRRSPSIQSSVGLASNTEFHGADGPPHPGASHQGGTSSRPCLTASPNASTPSACPKNVNQPGLADSSIAFEQELKTSSSASQRPDMGIVHKTKSPTETRGTCHVQKLRRSQDAGLRMPAGTEGSAPWRGLVDIARTAVG